MCDLSPSSAFRALQWGKDTVMVIRVCLLRPLLSFSYFTSRFFWNILRVLLGTLCQPIWQWRQPKSSTVQFQTLRPLFRIKWRLSAECVCSSVADVKNRKRIRSCPCESLWVFFSLPHQNIPDSALESCFEKTCNVNQSHFESGLLLMIMLKTGREQVDLPVNVCL